MKVNIGDYVNGYRVEKIEKISEQKHYLVTYLCPMANKPQSVYLPESKVETYMSKEKYNECCNKR